MFEQGRLRTFLKCTALLAAYSIVLALVMGAIGVATLWLA